MTTTRHPCGCVSTDSHYVKMCEPCAAEFSERHERAKEEKDLAEILGRYSTEEEVK